MKHLILFVAALAALAFAGCTSPSDGGEPENLVEMKNVAFEPAEITITAGETVTWINRDSFPHTVTSDETSNETFDSGNMDQGESFEHTFTTPGTFTYHCVPHQNMKATVTVVAA